MKKVIVITGASSGIGAALARQFARDEVILALVARRREALEAVAKSVEEAGGTASRVSCGYGRPNRCFRMF